MERAAIQKLVHKRRCVIVVNGFYEWKSLYKQGKQPYYISTDGTPDSIMYLAGFYDRNLRADGSTLTTCSIITKDASPSFAWLHDRMPIVFYSRKDADQWASTIEYAKVQHYIKESKSDVQMYPVTSKGISRNIVFLSFVLVGKTTYQEPDCHVELKQQRMYLKIIIYNEFHRNHYRFFYQETFYRRR